MCGVGSRWYSEPYPSWSLSWSVSSSWLWCGVRWHVGGSSSSSSSSSGSSRYPGVGTWWSDSFSVWSVLGCLSRCRLLFCLGVCCRLVSSDGGNRDSKSEPPPISLSCDLDRSGAVSGLMWFGDRWMLSGGRGVGPLSSSAWSGWSSWLSGRFRLRYLLLSSSWLALLACCRNCRCCGSSSASSSSGSVAMSVSSPLAFIGSCISTFSLASSAWVWVSVLFGDSMMSSSIRSVCRWIPNCG